MTYVFMCFVILIIMMIFSQVKHINRSKRIKLLRNSKPYWIHVSGFHHSGTGVLRNMLIRDLDATTLRTAVQLPTQDEGHWMQDVYPCFKNRNVCSTLDHVLRQYTCPMMLEKYLQSDYKTRQEISKKLESQWMQHIEDPSKTIIIQKTPTFDMLYLDTVLPNSAHALVMRHPYHWHWGPGKKVKNMCNNAWDCFQAWKAVWSKAFQDLKKVNEYVVFQYEVLPEKIDWNPRRQQRRRLEFRGNKIDFDKFRDIKNKYHDKHWNSITPEMYVKLAKWEKFVQMHFGYSLLNRTNAFVSVKCCKLASKDMPFEAEFHV